MSVITTRVIQTTVITRIKIAWNDNQTELGDISIVTECLFLRTTFYFVEDSFTLGKLTNCAGQYLARQHLQTL